MHSNASINFTDGRGGNPSQDNSPSKPSKPDKKPGPLEQQKERQRNRLQDQKKQIEKKLKRLTPITAPMKALAYRIAADDPNKDRNELFRTIRPTLTKFQIQNLLIPNKTEYIPGETNSQKLSKFEVTFRRQNPITKDIINRIKRNEDYFESLRWNSQGMIMTIWAAFEETQEVSPAIVPGYGSSC